MKITYGIHDTCLGKIIVAESEKGLCWLGFMDDSKKSFTKGDGFERMKTHFPKAFFERDDAETRQVIDVIVHLWEEGVIYDGPLDLQGSELECAVWKALVDIPRGQVVSYGQVANDVGRPQAARAIGSAIGRNPVSLVIPCHRVVRADKTLGHYGYGPSLKQRILEAEGVKLSRDKLRVIQ